MIVKCEICQKTYDDEFRLTFCPHDTFAANDGNNNFAHHPEAPISDDEKLCPCGHNGDECVPYSIQCLYG